MFLSSFLAFAQKKAVVITMTYREPYCGGARPSPEMEEAAQKARPYARKKMILVASNGKASSIKTDVNGILKLKLQPGVYRVFESWRYAHKTPKGMPLNNFDAECLKTEWQKETMLITVSAEKTFSEVKNEIITFCPWNLPCMVESFRPPMPQ